MTNYEEYIILRRNTTEELEDTVQEAMEEYNLQPVGGISAIVIRSEFSGNVMTEYYQAMAR